MSDIEAQVSMLFSDDDRRRYVDGLATVIRPGGRLFLLCFSDEETGTQGPRRVSRQEIESAFTEGWKLSDEALAAILDDPRNELHVLYVDGTPAGFAELDRRQPPEIELVQFGLRPEFIGQGLGKWFLQWTIDKVWNYQPKRFWLHTCTLDHAAALPNYVQAGFVQFKQEAIRRELLHMALAELGTFPANPD